MGLLKGITVTLYARVQVGMDSFNAPVYRENPVPVDNVLVCPTSSSDVVDAQGMDGKRAEYELCIPKGDANSWEGCRVDFFGQSWRVFGPVLEYIEELTPLEWNRRVRVERYG